MMCDSNSDCVFSSDQGDLTCDTSPFPSLGGRSGRFPSFDGRSFPSFDGRAGLRSMDGRTGQFPSLDGRTGQFPSLDGRTGQFPSLDGRMGSMDGQRGAFGSYEGRRRKVASFEGRRRKFASCDGRGTRDTRVGPYVSCANKYRSLDGAQQWTSAHSSTRSLTSSTHTLPFNSHNSSFTTSGGHQSSGAACTMCTATTTSTTTTTLFNTTSPFAAAVAAVGQTCEEREKKRRCRSHSRDPSVGRCERGRSVNYQSDTTDWSDTESCGSIACQDSQLEVTVPILQCRLKVRAVHKYRLKKYKVSTRSLAPAQ